jgi:hypothetical protein
MHNKILVVETDKAARDELETILQEIAQEGGELFFCDQKEEALAIIKKEHPPVVLLEHTLFDKSWSQEGVCIIVTVPRGVNLPDGQEYLIKPFRSHQVLEKCRAYLTLEVVPPIPPM